MYEQLRAPNLSVVGQSGLCLVYVREVFAVEAKYPTATANWNANSSVNHPGEQPPANVSVPCFFKYLVDGVDEGHVIVSVDGSKFYTVSKEGDQILGSIDEVIEKINVDGAEMEYLGWSEEIESTPVVKVAVVAPAPTPVPTYKVVDGDTLSRIAENHDLTLAEIEAKNPQITNPNLILIGQEINI